MLPLLGPGMHRPSTLSTDSSAQEALVKLVDPGGTGRFTRDQFVKALLGTSHVAFRDWMEAALMDANDAEKRRRALEAEQAAQQARMGESVCVCVNTVFGSLLTTRGPLSRQATR